MNGRERDDHHRILSSGEGKKRGGGGRGSHHTQHTERKNTQTPGHQPKGGASPPAQRNRREVRFVPSKQANSLTAGHSPSSTATDSRARAPFAPLRTARKCAGDRCSHTAPWSRALASQSGATPPMRSRSGGACECAAICRNTRVGVWGRGRTSYLAEHARAGEQLLVLADQLAGAGVDIGLVEEAASFATPVRQYLGNPPPPPPHTQHTQE